MEPDQVAVKAKSGIEFVRIGTMPYIRRDGNSTVLSVWQGACRKCGDPFVIRSTLNATPETTVAFERVHCEIHKLTERQRAAIWHKARKRGN